MANLLTAEQYNLEGGTTTGWTGDGNTTLSNQTDFATLGTHSLGIDTVGGSGSAQCFTPQGNSGVAVQASQSYNVSAECGSISTNKTVSLSVDWYKSDGSASTHPTDTHQINEGNGFNLISDTYTSPSDAAFASIRIDVTSLGANSQRWDEMTLDGPAGSSNVTITPGVLVITIVTFAPSVGIGSFVTPGVKALTLSTFSPTLTITGNVYLQPAVRALVITTYASPEPVFCGLSLSDVMDAIANQVMTSGVTPSAYGWPNPNPTVPCAVVFYPTRIDWMTLGGADCSAELDIPLYFLVGKVDDRSSRDALSKVIDGSVSIKTMLDGTLNGAVSSCIVQDVTIEQITIGEVDYLAAKFALNIFS